MGNARRTDPASSHAAADYIEKAGIKRGQCEKVLAVLRGAKNRTALELAHMSGLDRHMVAKRLADLERKGLAVCLRQVKRMCTVSGRWATTWNAT